MKSAHCAFTSLDDIIEGLISQNTDVMTHLYASRINESDPCAPPK